MIEFSVAHSKMESTQKINNVDIIIYKKLTLWETKQLVIFPFSVTPTTDNTKGNLK